MCRADEHADKAFSGIIKISFTILKRKTEMNLEVLDSRICDTIQCKEMYMFRWKERYFVLTKDYVHCFKKGSGRITEMGGFVFKVGTMEEVYIPKENHAFSAVVVIRTTPALPAIEQIS